MGKYSNSKLHAWYSDWHWKKCARGSLLCDTDILVLKDGGIKQRLWMEMRPGTPLAVFDIKQPGDGITSTERDSNHWYEEAGLPVYIIYVEGWQRNRPTFTVTRWQSGETRLMVEAEYIRWIDTRGYLAWNRKEQ